MVPDTDSGEAILHLHRIDSTNPSLAEQMHNCTLRAGLSHWGAGNSEFVITHPSAWLGTAYHYVLEKAAELNADSIDIDEKISGYWDSKISELYQNAKEHPLNVRWGAPEDWPGYRFTRGMAIQKGRSAVNIYPSGNGDRITGGHRSTEPFLQSANGKLVGRPDVVSGDTVLDYKTGYVVDITDGVEILRESYVRQLRLYAFLIHEVRGYWPTSGVVDSMKGGRIEIEIDPAECNYEASSAIFLLDSYNTALENGQTADTLASPSPEACRWCPFQLACQPFWDQALPEWYEVMKSTAVEGQLLSPPQMTRDELAFSISLTPNAGTERVDRVLVKPLESNIYSNIELMQQGDSLRVVGAFRRSNGTLGRSTNTQVSGLSSIPRIKIAETGA